jgi:acyl-CoA dehydrogenase
MPSGGLDVDELMELARDTDLEDGPAIRNQQVRSRSPTGTSSSRA